jgi:hypothetical protein
MFNLVHHSPFVRIARPNTLQVDAVTKTSVTLPVKQRVADGLSRAGTSNSLKVLSYNAILGSIAFFAVGAIRQFCVFAIVVLVAHWFLAHTFFMAVLSIDVQRLEVRLAHSLIGDVKPVYRIVHHLLLRSSRNCCVKMLASHLRFQRFPNSHQPLDRSAIGKSSSLSPGVSSKDVQQKTSAYYW